MFILIDYFELKLIVTIRMSRSNTRADETEIIGKRIFAHSEYCCYKIVFVNFKNMKIFSDDPRREIELVRD